MKLNISKEKGYSSVDDAKEKNIVISGKEQGKNEAELEEERKEEVIKRELQHTEKISLGGPINVFGEPVFNEIKNTEDSHSVDYTKTKVVPEKIVLDTSGNKVITQDNSSPPSIVMEPTYLHMDALSNPILEQPRTFIHIESKNKRTQKLSPAEELLSKLLASDRQAYEQQCKGLLLSTLNGTLTDYRLPIIDRQKKDSPVVSAMRVLAY